MRPPRGNALLTSLFARTWPVRGSYSRATLWRRSILEWQRSRCDVYVYFDNDPKEHRADGRARAAPLASALLRRQRLRLMNYALFRFDDGFGDKGGSSDYSTSRAMASCENYYHLRLC